MSYNWDTEPEECEHEFYDISINTGRAECHRCDHTWIATKEEIFDEINRINDYDIWQAKQEHPWNRFKRWLKLRWSLSGGAWIGWARWWLRTTKLGYRYKRWRRDRQFKKDFGDELPF